MVVLFQGIVCKKLRKHRVQDSNFFNIRWRSLLILRNQREQRTVKMQRGAAVKADSDNDGSVQIRARENLYEWDVAEKNADADGGDLVFQVLSWHNTDVTEQDESEKEEDEDEDEEDAGVANTRGSAHMIKMFGVTRYGESVAVTVHGFTPYFFVKVPSELQSSNVAINRLLPRALREIARECRLGPGGEKNIIDIKPLKKKDFWGFRAGEQETFLRITFRRLSAMRSLSYHLAKKEVRVGPRSYKLELYESNIDPLLRFIHIRNLCSAGWVRVPKDKASFGACEVMPAESSVTRDASVAWTDVHPVEGRGEEISPMLVASFDIECNSSHGDFPVPVKTYRRLAVDLLQYAQDVVLAAQADGSAASEYDAKKLLSRAVRYGTRVIGQEEAGPEIVARVAQMCFKHPDEGGVKRQRLETMIDAVVDDIYVIAAGRWRNNPNRSLSEKKEASVTSISSIANVFSEHGFPELKGDEVIQIGTTFHVYGQQDCCFRHIIVLDTCEPAADSSIPTQTVSCSTEAELLTGWTDMMRAMDPDIVVGYNIFGFDMSYMYQRAKQLGVEQRFMRLGRLYGVAAQYNETTLSSSAMGDNVLMHIAMQGRTTLDLLKLVQKEHKLESYKLDNVAKHFMGLQKNDLLPGDIFRMQRGSAADRRVIAEYCLQDCALCNRLVIKLEVIANNLGMANVCSVPFSYIFMRGQGIKVFSLVARQCRMDRFVVPVKKGVPASAAADEGTGILPQPQESDGYEGAIVLDPKVGMYLDDPVVVLDYASLYPSSMISENISHDCLVVDPRYAGIPGVQYRPITYDTPEGPCTCHFVQPSSSSDSSPLSPGQKKGVLPRILEQLLRQRKLMRKRISLMTGRCLDAEGNAMDVSGNWCEEEGVMVDATGVKYPVHDAGTVRPLYNEFQKAVLDGLQNAYKVTANSLYGQMGAKTSPLYLKHIAACTTATGRSLILQAKEFMERRRGANIIYGDTDSLFMIFDLRMPDPDNPGRMIKPKEKEALRRAIELAHEASHEFKPFLRAPHDLEYDKTFWPFVIFAKKRYIGNLYEDDVNKCKPKSMGVVLKRRDNAPIVKHVYGGIIDIILNRRDVQASITFLKQSLSELIDGLTPTEQLVITKTLKASYADPERIAHWVLAQRIGDRDPGNKPQSNDRIPYIYVQVPAQANMLQGERIEDPRYAVEKRLKPDIEFYITNQIMKPVLQIYSIVLEQIDGYARRAHYWEEMRLSLLEKTPDKKKAQEKFEAMREKEVKALLFDPFLERMDLAKQKTRRIDTYFSKSPVVRPVLTSNKRLSTDVSPLVEQESGQKNGTSTTPPQPHKNNAHRYKQSVLDLARPSHNYGYGFPAAPQIHTPNANKQQPVQKPKQKRAAPNSRLKQQVLQIKKDMQQQCHSSPSA